MIYQPVDLITKIHYTVEPITKGIKQHRTGTEVEESSQPGTPTKNVYNATLYSKIEKE
jgi:hypothetical protein